MWSRVRKAHIKRYAQVRLRIHRRDPIQRLPIGGQAARRASEGVSGRMLRRIQQIGRTVRRAARNGLASYLRTGNSTRPPDPE
jgi:hypothetical protein